MFQVDHILALVLDTAETIAQLAQDVICWKVLLHSLAVAEVEHQVMAVVAVGAVGEPVAS